MSDGKVSLKLEWFVGSVVGSGHIVETGLNSGM